MPSNFSTQVCLLSRHLMLKTVLRVLELWKFHDTFGLWKNALFSLTYKKIHHHSKVIVRFSLNLAREFVYLIDAVSCKLFKEFLKISGHFRTCKNVNFSSNFPKKIHLYNKFIVCFILSLESKFADFVSAWYNKRIRCLPTPKCWCSPNLCLICI